MKKISLFCWYSTLLSTGKWTGAHVTQLGLFLIEPPLFHRAAAHTVFKHKHKLIIIHQSKKNFFKDWYNVFMSTFEIIMLTYDFSLFAFTFNINSLLLIFCMFSFYKLYVQYTVLYILWYSKSLVSKFNSKQEQIFNILIICVWTYLCCMLTCQVTMCHTSSDQRDRNTFM